MGYQDPNPKYRKPRPDKNEEIKIERLSRLDEGYYSEGDSYYQDKQTDAIAYRSNQFYTSFLQL